MYEIWSVGHKPFENFTNTQVEDTLPPTYVCHLHVLHIQALELLDTGARLSPPPGCPRALYSIMISCWYACVIKTAAG